jgi:threonine synthase
VEDHYQPVCLQCEAEAGEFSLVCERCGGSLGFRYDFTDIKWDDSQERSMWRYWRLLPVNSEQIVSLGEGGTPLIVSRGWRHPRVLIKDETRNPTGSQKDRPLAVAISHASRLGKNLSVVVSSGSTGISNAALASRAGMKAVIVAPRGAPDERLYPVFALGASLVEVDGEIDEIIDAVESLCRERGYYLSSTCRSSNPYQAEGAKTIAYETAEQLGNAPDWVVLPVGGGGTVAAVWRGFQDLYRLGRVSRLPRLLGVVPNEFDTLELAWKAGLKEPRQWSGLIETRPRSSILTKLAHVYPPDGQEALVAIEESHGFLLSVTDAQAVEAQQRLGKQEGIYAEPSSTAALAGLEQACELGLVKERDDVVLVITGSGHRETFVSMRSFPITKRAVDPSDIGDFLARLSNT